MKRIKVIGSSVGLALGLVALIAAMAVASYGDIGLNTNGPQFEAEGQFPMDLEGSNAGTGTSAVWKLDGQNTAGRTVTCKDVTYKGLMPAMASPFVTATPSYANCELSGLPTAVRMNGCIFAFEVLADGTGLEDLVCPEGRKVELRAYLSQQSMLEDKNLACKAEISRRNNMPVSYEGTALGTLVVKSAMTGLKSTLTRYNTFLCPAAHTGTFETGTYTDHVRIEGV